MSDSPINLHHTASRIAELYCFVRRESDPDYVFNPRSTNQNTFTKAAELCNASGLSPEAFVQQQYENRPNPNGPFYPNMLLNTYTKLTKEDSSFTGFHDVHPAMVFKIQEGYLRDQLTRRKRPVEEALLDDEIAFFPWFRVLITDKPIPSVIAKYKDKVKASLYPALVAFLSEQKFDLSRFQ